MTDQQQDTPKLNKSDSARVNGAKSQGASTETGKRNSANANLRHGAYSKRVVLDGEIPAFYEEFKSNFLEHFRPADPFEFECVESMVTARWRIRRIESAETCLLNVALLDNKDANDAKFDSLDILHERAIAVESKSAALETLIRLQDRLHRIYERNFKLLANARRKSGRAVPDPEPSFPQIRTGPSPQLQEPAPPVPAPELPPESKIDPTAPSEPSHPTVSGMTGRSSSTGLLWTQIDESPRKESNMAEIFQIPELAEPESSRSITQRKPEEASKNSNAASWFPFDSNFVTFRRVMDNDPDLRTRLIEALTAEGAFNPQSDLRGQDR